MITFNIKGVSVNSDGGRVKFQVMTFFGKIFNKCYNKKEVDKKMAEVNLYIKDSLEEFNKKIILMHEAIVNLEEALKEKDRYIKSLLVCKEEHNGAKEKLISEINRLRHKNKNLVDKNKELEQAVTLKDKKSKEDTNKKISETSSYVLKLDSKNKKLENLVETLKKEITELKKRVSN